MTELSQQALLGGNLLHLGCSPVRLAFDKPLADSGTWSQSVDTCRSRSTKYAGVWPVPVACRRNLDLDSRQKQSLVSTSTCDLVNEEGEVGDTPQVVELAVSWSRNQRWLSLQNCPSQVSLT